MKLSLIVAMSNGGVIGYKGKLPWERIPEDMALFQRITSGHPIILGRKTWESIQNGLPGRRKIVVSRSLETYGNLTSVVRSPLDALFLAARYKDRAFIAGGAEIYKVFGRLCDEAHITVIERDYSGDTQFPWPILHDPEWRLCESCKLTEGVSYMRVERRQ